MTQEERIFLIDQEIAKGIYPNETQLIQLCKSSRMTIFRDLKKMKDDYKAPVFYDNFQKGYGYSVPGFRLIGLIKVQKDNNQILINSLVTDLLEKAKGTPAEKCSEEIFNLLIK